MNLYVKELSEMVFELIKDSKSKIVYKDLPLDDPCKKRPDIILANNKIKQRMLSNLGRLSKINEYLVKNKELNTKK